jgi:hypothetical protein
MKIQNEYNETKMTIDDEWTQFLKNQNSGFTKTIQKTTFQRDIEDADETITKCSELTISTKTKVLFLDKNIDIQSIFWKLEIVDYWKPVEGILKKQMKVVSKTREEYDDIQLKLSSIRYYTDNVIKQIDNPDARRMKFKDERKITVGISKKDIMFQRGKIKNAFYNCFALVLRFNYDGVFRELHVKVFNTGKLEIPGVINAKLLSIVKKMILEILQPHMDETLGFKDNDETSNVLINSNFNCGYFINRDKLHSLLRSQKYTIESSYDQCSYPGVKCKFYYNNELSEDDPRQNGCVLPDDRTMKMSELSDTKKYTEVSIMIFRTGSGLIVGNCSDTVLDFIFNFIKRILETEYKQICCLTEKSVTKNKTVKSQKRNIIMTPSYYKLTLLLDTDAPSNGSVIGMDLPEKSGEL